MESVIKTEPGQNLHKWNYSRYDI